MNLLALAARIAASPPRLKRSAGALAWVCVVSLVAVLPLRASLDRFAAFPDAPSADKVRQLSLARDAIAEARAAITPLSVDTNSREAVRQFYLSIYQASNDVPMAWTGSHAPGNWGTTSDAFKEAVRLRINAFRALAGVPAAVALNSTYSAKAQQAALMMSLNDTLSHTPGTGWTGYTADGAEAAGNSNLAIGQSGPGAITGYIVDAQSNNTAAGHRRWLLYPQTTEMGTGDIAASGAYRPANATWVITSQYGNPRPATRTAYVAWPPRGYTPAPLIFPRWSFSYPAASFANATVTMTRDGAPVAAALEPLTNGAGENTLVWVYGGLDSGLATTPTVTTDSTFRVTVSNAMIGGTPQSFTYEVIAFDPERAGADTVPVTVSGTSTPTPGTANSYAVARPTFANGAQWRRLTLDASVPAYGAENALDGATATTTGNYSARVTAPVSAGGGAYHLAMPDFASQYLTLPDTFHASAAGTPRLTFRSRLGWASTDQVARVQVSTDDGVAWSDLYSQPGSGSAGENSYVSRSVSLAPLASGTFRLRFAYTFISGSAYPQTDAYVGWLLDEITLSGVQRVASASAPASTSGDTFTLNPATTGAAGLQARGVLFGQYPMAWGPVLPITVSAGLVFTTQPASQVANLGGSLTLSVAATAAVSPSFQWLRNGVSLVGATSTSLTVANVQPVSTGLYTATITSSSGAGESRPAIVGLTSPVKVVGAGTELTPTDIHHPNGNIFDQVLLTGVAETITADPDQVTRTSFIDLDNDIVQVEFSGPGSLSLVLDDSSGPAVPAYYNQANVTYMKGHAGIVITGADEHTNVSVFTVGRITAVNQALFKDTVTYDGIADIAFIAVASTNGKFGGVRTSNANYFAQKGFTGVYAPGIEFHGPVYLGDLSAFGSAKPVIVLGSVLAETRITGGDLFQDNGEPIQVSGITQLKFTPGGDSHGHELLAQANRAVLIRDGQNVTTQLVVDP